MNPIEKLYALVRAKFQGATVELTRPLREDGVWSLEIDLGTTQLTAEWSRVTDKIGISSVDGSSYGEAPDETYSTVSDAERRVGELLSNQHRTSAPIGVQMARLREARKATQQEVAVRMEVRQASVSGYESREDIHLETLKRFVAALGGDLEIVAKFSDYQCHLVSGPPPWLVNKAVEPVSQVCNRFEIADFPGLFPALHKSGRLKKAIKAAEYIKSAHAVTEMPECAQ